MAHKRKTVLVSISLLPELLAGLDWLAQEGGRNRSSQLSWLIAQEVKQKKLKKSVASP
jgi:metal-responsive CopG/Arc/MetJ family transcriptional regulator